MNQWRRCRAISSFTKALQGKLFAYHRKTLMGFLNGVDAFMFYKKYKKAKHLLSTTVTRLAV